MNSHFHLRQWPTTPPKTKSCSEEQFHWIGSRDSFTGNFHIFDDKKRVKYYHYLRSSLPTQQNRSHSTRKIGVRRKPSDKNDAGLGSSSIILSSLKWKIPGPAVQTPLRAGLRSSSGANQNHRSGLGLGWCLVVSTHPRNMRKSSKISGNHQVKYDWKPVEPPMKLEILCNSLQPSSMILQIRFRRFINPTNPYWNLQHLWVRGQQRHQLATTISLQPVTPQVVLPQGMVPLRWFPEYGGERMVTIPKEIAKFIVFDPSLLFGGQWILTHARMCG